MAAPRVTFPPPPPTKRLDGKIAIVTGSSSGIGRAISFHFAAHGAKVLCADLRPTIDTDQPSGDEEAATHEVIQQQGGEAVYERCNVSQAEDVRNVVDKVVAKFGKLDILVNNAGIPEITLGLGVHDVSEETFDRTIAVNFKGVFLGCKYAIAQMLKQGLSETGDRGWIVNISSVASLRGMTRTPVYGASKAAVNGLTRCVATDYGAQGIHCNAIAPAYVQTPLLFRAAKHFSSIDPSAAAALHPLKGIGFPDDVARAALFLVTADSGWVTGQVLPVDGGFTAR